MDKAITFMETCHVFNPIEWAFTGLIWVFVLFLLILAYKFARFMKL